MNFLNLVMVGGVTAAAIPIIIHLFHKSRFKVVNWGAMHLLAAVVRTNQKRIKIEQLILLAIRCAIPILLALMMARPMWQGAAGLRGDQPTSTVVLLDNSYSMAAGRAGTSNFSLARDETQRLLGGLPRGSEAYVFLMGEGAGMLDESTRDISRVTEALDKEGAGYGVARVPAALDFVAGTVGNMTEGPRQVVVLTDFQRLSFPVTEDELLGHALERLKALPFPPGITLWDVGPEVTENVAVESVEFSKLMVGVGQKIQIRANLRNYGETARSDLRVTMKIDGRAEAPSQVALGAKAGGQILFTHVFDTPGSHVVEIETEGDELKADNSFLASITVRDRLSVLLVDGAPGTTPDDLKGETGFAQIALSPFSAGNVEQADLIQTTVVPVEALTAAKIGEAAVVVLANVAALADGQLAALELFVQQGGGLLVFTGDRTDPAWWNGAFGSLAPLPMGSLAEDLPEGAPAMGIASQRFDHPALGIFNDPANGNLSDVAIKSWFRLKQPEQNTGPGDAVILARLDSGDPFLVEKSSGEGRVIACATALDSDWSNFPARPSYLPFVQRLCVYLASNIYPPRNLQVGEQLVGFLPAESAGGIAQLTLPDASTVELAVVGKGERGVVEYAQTRSPGLYTLQTPGGGAPIHFVVNADRGESDLAKLTDSEIEALAEAHGLQLVRSGAEFKALDKVRRYGHELWKWLLLALLGLLFVELFLQQKFARGRSKA
ncbi:MAG: BatA domain-containing protein [Verrucomicrobia bacterium]|nr:BatA domain-containing protein [Verrucomicrobiota bacterium]MDA1005313.1 BatA domain-containing protein [Verrucomicrobiota bacterium]